ncbi:MAG: flavodoxin [Ruminococcus sp.]|nr:flavodoxin [Ruminococcus sp.]
MKTLIKRMILMALALGMTLLLAACGAADNQKETSVSTETGIQEETENQETVQNDAAGIVSEENETEQAVNDEEERMDTGMIVIYFSLAGEQYSVGVIEEGNTSIIARMIAEQTGADLFEIEAAEPYPQTYSELLDVSRQEMSENARPAYVGDVENWEEYDTVFIGYPNWWGDMPMIVYSFLESHDWNGKTVIPFCTHGGSGLSGTEATIEDITGAAMLDGFAITGEAAQNDREASENRVTEWLKEIGLTE